MKTIRTLLTVKALMDRRPPTVNDYKETLRAIDPI
jgi:hypothetical protein